MAYAITDKPNTEAPSADYPFGNIKDKNGSIAGTPVNKLVYADFHQFFAKLMDLAGITANGLPDNDYSGFQLVEALLTLTVRRKVIPIGAWNMDATATLFLAHGLDLGGAGTTVANIRGVRCVIINDAESSAFEIDYWNGTIVGGTVAVSGTFVLLTRTIAGFFDSADFNDTGINRGYVIIEYFE